jgi:hypothetical protein
MERSDACHRIWIMSMRSILAGPWVPKNREGSREEPEEAVAKERAPTVLHV